MLLLDKVRLTTAVVVTAAATVEVVTTAPATKVLIADLEVKEQEGL